MASIPASAIVSVNPQVIAAGGDALEMNGLILTNSARFPIGSVPLFASAADVAAYAGPTSDEAIAAGIYFQGFENSNRKPGALLIAQYPVASVAGYLRGGNLASSITLDQLKTLSGVLTVSVDGTSKTSSNISLTGATSFSNAATLIQAGFTSPGFTVTFDSVSGAFVFTSATTGAASSMTVASGTLAAPLRLTSATGAAVSAGAVAAAPASFMGGIVASTTNWASFTTLFNPDGNTGLNTVKMAFAAWVNSTNRRFGYFAWDTDPTPTQSSAAVGSMGYLLNVGNFEGTCPIWTPTWTKAVMGLGYVAAVDYDQLNGRTTMAFRRVAGQAPDVTNQTVGANLLANGYTFYGSYSTADDEFTWFYNGQISGDFAWADSYFNQIWLNNALQLALMVLLRDVYSIPYNQAGYALIQAACNDPIQAALNFGAIRSGVTLSSSQAAQVNSRAGVKIDDVLRTQGYYLQVRDASPVVRQARGSPPCTLFYMDGQSVQQINLASIAVQ